MKKFFLVLSVLIPILFQSCTKENVASTPKIVSILRVGTAKLEITPKNTGDSYPLEGYGTIISQGVHDPITARCIIIDDGKQKLAFITVDLCLGFAAYPLFYPRLKEAIEKINIPAKNIFVSAIHTHSAPSMRRSDYAELVFNKLGELIVEANSALEPATVYYNSGVITGKTKNRRHPERQPDGTVITMRFLNAQGKCLASLINFACHAVILGPDNTLISADFVYYLRERIEKEYGGTALFINRHAGDINPPGGYNRSGGTFAMAEDFGVSIANDIIAMQSSEKPDKITIKVNRKITKDGSDLSIIDFGKAQIMAIPGESLSDFGNIIDDILPGPYKFYFSYTDGNEGYIVPQNEWGKCKSSFMPQCYEETRSHPSLAETLEQEYRKMAKDFF